jgi:hypothetical protein
MYGRLITEDASHTEASRGAFALPHAGGADKRVHQRSVRI